MYTIWEKSIWDNIKKSSKIRECQIALISLFAYIFSFYDQNVISARETRHKALSQPNLEMFLIISSFVRSYISSRSVIPDANRIIMLNIKSHFTCAE